MSNGFREYLRRAAASGSLAMLAAMRLASSRVSRKAASSAPIMEFGRAATSMGIRISVSLPATTAEDYGRCLDH